MENADNEEFNISEIIKKTVYANKLNLTPEQLEKQEEVMKKIFEEGMLPGQALGFSEKFLEYVYKYAYSFYQQNKIEEAGQLCRWLKTMSPYNSKFTIALIHCLIQQKNWLGATSYLMELAYLNPKDPEPFEKMCDCLLELDDLPGALVAINKAIDRAGDKSEYTKEKEKWRMKYDSILSQLNIDPAIIEKVRAQRQANSLNEVKTGE